MKLSGAIFYMDGTLLNSMIIWSRMGEEYLISRGILGEGEHDAVFDKLPMSGAIRYMKETYGIVEEEKKIRRWMTARMESFYGEEVELKEGAFEALKRFHKAGTPMCVATATDRALAEIGLQKTGIRDFFQEVYSCHEFGRGKEHPDIYEAALRGLGTKREETVVFEDALYAAKTAGKAGFPVVGLFDASEEEQEALQTSVDAYFISWQDWLKDERFTQGA